MAISEIVKYDNKLNMISFKELNKLDGDVFFSILARLKEKGTEKVTLSFAELTEYMPKNISNKEILAILDTSTNKLASSIIRYETPSTITKFAIFQLFEIDRDNFYITAQISEPFLFLLNNLETGFTAFELAEFSSLSSKYTQTLYRLLKQFKKTGYRVMQWGEFLEVMNVPSSYNMGTIDMRVINPSIKELSQEPSLFEPNNPIFKKLTYKKIRGTGRGRPVKKIEFSFTPEIDPIDGAPKTQIDACDLKEPLKKSKKTEQKKPKSDNWKPEIKEFIEQMRGEKIDEFSEFIGLNLRMLDKKTNDFNTLKIENIEQKGDKIIATLLNRDDNYRNQMKFDTIEALSNFVKKYRF